MPFNEKSSKPVALVAVQDSPVAFDLDASVVKLKSLAQQAAKEARSSVPESDVVVVFPEAFLSCYPRGYDFGAKVGSRAQEGREWFRRYHESSVPVTNVEGAVMKEIRAAARDNDITLVVGVIERCDEKSSGPPPASYGSENPGGMGTLYCTTITISPQGQLLASHRKLMPTGSERLVWGQGDGAGLRVVDTPVGKVGSVICWENYMPALRMAMYAKGVEIYTAPTADCRDAWQSTMRHIGLEGRCFVVGCCQYAEKQDYPQDYPPSQDLSPNEIITRGGSVIVSPLGDVLAGPLFDKRGILVAQVDRNAILEARMDFDAVGSYGRTDMFTLQIDESSKPATQSIP